MDIYEKLIYLAQLQEATNRENTELETELMPLMAKVNDLKNRIKANDSVYEEAVTEFKEQVLAYIAETGDIFGNVSEVTFARRTKWVYDDDAAIEWAEINAPETIKRSLDKRLFEKTAVKSFNGAEQINVPEIRLATKLGHLLISHPTNDNT